MRDACRPLHLSLIALVGSGIAVAQPRPLLYTDASRITECATPGLGRARLTWSMPVPVETQIRVGSPSGVALTGWNAEAYGVAETGDWVSDGMSFHLVDRGGSVLAATLVKVRCGETRASWFPLDVGNEWIYFTKTRQVTGGYAAMRVASTDIIGERLCFNIVGGPFDRSRLCEDDLGRIWRTNDFSALAPQLFLDPTTDSNPAARYPTHPGPDSSLEFAGVVTGALSSESGGFGKGTGLVELTSTVVAGSSGGFGASYSLVRARVGGKVVRETSDYSLSLGVESRELTLRPGLVTNCAVPCYFVACGLVPGADPPGTFKPCMRARLTFAAPVPVGATVQLRLKNANGEAVYQSDVAEPRGGSERVRESSLFQQLPLYTAPNLPLPPGAYLLTGAVQTPGGQLTSTVPLQILP